MFPTMKTLLIMRHAKSDYPPGISDDFDRPLNKRGRADLPRIARLLAAYGPHPEVVLASAARRAHQTATGLVESLGLPASVLHLDDALYLSSPSTLTQAAAGLPDSAQTGLIIAHNPGQEEWIREPNRRTHPPADRGSSRGRIGHPLLARNQSRALALFRGAAARKSHDSITMSG